MDAHRSQKEYSLGEESLSRIAIQPAAFWKERSGARLLGARVHVGPVRKLLALGQLGIGHGMLIRPACGSPHGLTWNGADAESVFLAKRNWCGPSGRAVARLRAAEPLALDAPPVSAGPSCFFMFLSRIASLHGATLELCHVIERARPSRQFWLTARSTSANVSAASLAGCCSRATGDTFSENYLVGFMEEIGSGTARTGRDGVAFASAPLSIARVADLIPSAETSNRHNPRPNEASGPSL